MNESEVSAIIQQCLIVILKIGGPLMIVGLIVGLIVSVLQAVTQINEATLAFVPKVLALGVTVVVLGSFMYSALTGFTQILLDRIAAVAVS